MMNPLRRNSRGGFSLVELLAVILVLAVLAAAAIPLYINTRRASAARACKANIAAIAAAESAFSLQAGHYSTNPMAAFNAANPALGGLVGAPQGLASPITCPLDNSAYRFTGGGSGEPLTISCPHCLPANGGDGSHDEAFAAVPAGADNQCVTLAAPPRER